MTYAVTDFSFIEEKLKQEKADKIQKDYKGDYFNSPKGWTARLLARTRSRCIAKELPFDLDIQWFRDILDKRVCEVTGIPFTYGYWLAGKAHPFSPSLDRTTPELGYTKDNVKVVCWIYNTAKHDFTHEDVVKLATALIKG